MSVLADNPAPTYALAPAPAYVKEEVFPPQPFAYQYGVQDSYDNSYSKTETQDEGGNVDGEYSVALPDGRRETVKYHADANGYVSDVLYEGVAQYPDTVKSSYVPAPVPAYQPAPVPVYKPAPVYDAPATTPTPHSLDRSWISM